LKISPDEKDLLIGCCKGDQRAQEAFVHRFSNLVYNTVLNTLKAKNAVWQPQDVEDLHNSVLLRLLEDRCKRLRRFQGRNGCSLASWIRIIAVRTVIDHLRRSKDALTHTTGQDSFELIRNLQADLAEPLQLMDHAQQVDSLHRGLRALLPRDRLFIKLHCLKGLSIPEVAGILSISENNAYSIKHRAIRRLKAVIGTGTVNGGKE
jgi:RNA polymerase sigma factor (sigma-70 family)